MVGLKEADLGGALGEPDSVHNVWVGEAGLEEAFLDADGVPSVRMICGAGPWQKTKEKQKKRKEDCICG